MDIVYGFSDRKWGSAHKNSNLTRFIESLGVEKPLALVRAEQVHGNNIANVEGKDMGRVIPEVDGLLTGKKGLFLVILAADCLPVLFFDPKRRLIAAVHAGWRGTAKGIAVEAVRGFSCLGSKPENIKTIFGPCICWKHYEVGDDVVSEFDKSGYSREAEFMKEGGKNFLDIRATNRNQLLAAGVLPRNIKTDPRCTFEDADLYSWRRERPHLSGEFAAVIAIK